MYRNGPVLKSQTHNNYVNFQFAEERANLRERGAALDAEIGRCERQISALEATRAVMQAAHKHFLRKITPLAEDSEFFKVR